MSHEGVRYVKKMTYLALGAALIAVPVLAAPGGDRNATLTRAEAQTKAAEMFAEMDTNNDGKLDAAERTAQRAEMQAKMFASLDADGNGSISKAEWDRHVADRTAKRGHRGRHHGMGGRSMGDGMMGKADIDGDQAISQAEFQTAVLARFDAADANKDGQVTPEERKAKRGEWRAKRGGAAAVPASE